MSIANIVQAPNEVVGAKRMQNLKHVDGDRSLDSTSHHLII